jgi:hypothetical protein
MGTMTSDITDTHIEKLAYRFWEERGRPAGSPEEDWFRAEPELRHHHGPSLSVDSHSPASLPFSSFSMGANTQ